MRRGLESAIRESEGLRLLPNRNGSMPTNAADAGFPDLVLADLSPGMGYAALQELLYAFKPGKVLLWANEIAVHLAWQAMTLGIRGVLRKTLPAAQQLESLKRVAGGELWFEKSLSDQFIKAKRVELTKREGELIGLLTLGMSNKEIATELDISEGTVKVYFSRLFDKTGTGDRYQLALYGLRNLTHLRNPPPGAKIEGLRSLMLESPAPGDSSPPPSESVRSWRGENVA